jgi:adhesin HecA-like repeat protein
VSNTGSLLASRSLNTATAGLIDNQGGVIQAKNVSLSAARLVNQGAAARIYGQTLLAFSAPAIVNLDGLIRLPRVRQRRCRSTVSTTVMAESKSPAAASSSMPGM